MVRVEDVARAALSGDALMTRALWAELLVSHRPASEITRPEVDDPDVLALAASLSELLAERRDEHPPPWARDVDPATESHYLLTTRTERRKRKLRELAPPPLRKRNFFAPPNYLTSV